MQEINNGEQNLSAKNLSEPLDPETLADLCNPSLPHRVAVIGVGNPLWGDDGAGPELLRRLRSEWEVQERQPDSHGKFFFIDAGDSPEDCLIRVADLSPDVILVMDAMDLHAEPGSVALLQSEALPEAVCCSTHRLPLKTLLRLWEAGGSKTLVLGIQPKDRVFRQGLSAEVEMSIDSLARFFTRTHCAG